MERNFIGPFYILHTPKRFPFDRPINPAFRVFIHLRDVYEYLPTVIPRDNNSRKNETTGTSSSKKRWRVTTKSENKEVGKKGRLDENKNTVKKKRELERGNIYIRISSLTFIFVVSYSCEVRTGV